MSILNWKRKALGHTMQFGGGGSSGGGGGTTQQSNQYSMISPWAQPYVSGILGAAQQQVFNTQQGTDASGNPTTEITGIRPYNAYGSYTGATDANGNPVQYGINPSSQAAANASVAGFNPLQNQAFQGASNLSQSAMPGITGNAAYGSLMAGQNLANQSTNPNAVGAYMNPYIQNTLDPALQILNQQYGIAGQQQQGQATQAGAFGGSREALMNSLNRQNQMLAQNQLVGNAYNQAFNNAQNQMNQVANLNLQGYGQAGSLAGQQLNQQQGILGLQNQFGGQQQQQAQNIINAGMSNYQQAQQYPMQQLGQLKGLLTGLPIQDVTTTQQQAQPALAGQLAGLGTAGIAGIALANQATKAEGGVIKSYAAGGSIKGYSGADGISAINSKVLRGGATPDQIARSTKDGIVAPQVGEIGKAIALSQKVNGQNAAAMSRPPPQGTIMDELEAKSAQMDQQEILKDAVPKAMEVLKHKIEKAIVEGDIPKAQKYTQELDQLVAIFEGKSTPQQEQAAPAPEGIEQLAPQAGAPAQPEQGIEAAPSNLPTKGMAKGGIASFASRGYVDEDEYQSAEDKEDEELKQMYGSGTDNDFIQSIMPAASKTAAHPSSAVQMTVESKEPKRGGHKYEAEVIKEARRIGLPENIAVHALYKETGNLKNPETAMSKAGAYGPMQLMERTAKELGVDRKDPIQNVMGGVGYLKKLYDKYQDPQLTLMAYNAGPGRVDRALKSEHGIASLPQETLSYRMAAGGVAHYDAGGGIDTIGAQLDALRSGEETLEKASTEGGARKPADPSVISAYENAKKERIAKEKEYYDLLAKEGVDKAAFMPQYSMQPNRPTPNPVVQAQATKTQELPNFGVKDASSWDDKPATPAAKPAAPAAPPAPPSNVSPAAQQGIDKITQTASAPSIMDQIAAEIMGDIKSRKEEAKRTRETNNLLAWMNAGFGMAGSKNIHPLGAIAEGGQQGISTLMAGRKQESEEAKDIAAQQYGLYKVAGAAEQNKVLNEIRNAQLGLKQTGAANRSVETARDDLNQFEKTRIAALKNRFPLGEMDPKYGAELAKIYSDPKYKALERIAYPSLYSTPASGESSSEKPPLSSFNK
jgi:soluble lytic murein transglycosylase-like protein